MTTSNTRVEIMNAIGKTDDHNLKMILLLMLGIMEEIGSKIDNIYDDKARLRAEVLNGHADIHHSDHEWIKHYRMENVQRMKIIERIEPVVLWAETKILEEKENKKLVKAGVAEVITGVVEKAVWVLIGVAVTVTISIITGIPPIFFK